MISESNKIKGISEARQMYGETASARARQALDDAFGHGIKEAHALLQNDAAAKRIYDCAIVALTAMAEQVEKPVEAQEDWEQRGVERLKAALAKPDIRDRELMSAEEFDPWHDVLDGVVGAYNSELDRLAIDVLKAVRDNTTFDLLNSERGLAAELFMHMLADWLCDYGTSPRGIFPANGLDDLWDELIIKWKTYARVYWNEEEK